jgi:chromosome segregation ATPase
MPLSPELIVALAAGVTAVGGVVCTGYTAHKQSTVADATAKVQGAATVIDGYNQLCKDLRSERDGLREEIKILCKRIADNETAMNRLRAEVRQAEAEKRALTDEVEQQRTKIACLERQNEALRAEIAELRRCQNGGG